MGSISCSGATSFQSLVERAANEFMDAHANVSVAISAGGSGQGLTQVVNGAVQIGRSDVFAEAKLDKSYLENLQDHKLCIVGIGPVVSDDVALESVSMDQLTGIFTGRITDWGELGAAPAPINVVERAAGSGTRATFEQTVLAATEQLESFRPVAEVDSTGGALEQVAQTPGSITYVAFNYMKTAGVHPLSIDGVAPERASVEHGAWTIWAYEHLYTRTDEPERTRAATSAFIEYLLSENFQATAVPEEGFIPLADMAVEKNAEGEIYAKA